MDQSQDQSFEVIRMGTGVHQCAKPDPGLYPFGTQIKCKTCKQIWEIKKSQKDGAYWDKPSIHYDPREARIINPSYGG